MKLPPIIQSRRNFPRIRPPIECANGTRVSVQASEMHYCTPPENVADDQYIAVEVGIFPDGPIPEYLKPYNTDPDGVPPASVRVFAYVPVGLVEQYIAENGGAK